MKVNKVAAFRVKRELRRESGTEPQMVGLTPPTNSEWEPDSMRKLIIRDGRDVEVETDGGMVVSGAGEPKGWRCGRVIPKLSGVTTRCGWSTTQPPPIEGFWIGGRFRGPGGRLSEPRSRTRTMVEECRAGCRTNMSARRGGSRLRSGVRRVTLSHRHPCRLKI